MFVQVLSDRKLRATQLCAMLAPEIAVRAAVLGDQLDNQGGKCAALIVVANLRSPEQVVNLREAVRAQTGVPQKIFIVDQRSHFATSQAYALGATTVLHWPLATKDLMSVLDHVGVGEKRSPERVASEAAGQLAKMFSAASNNAVIDITGAERTGEWIIESIAEHRLSRWLDAVRQHHQCTFQHCLLVAGVAVDFGLLLGLRRRDLQRLCSAALFHDIGKARVPLSILDKPGRLDPEERSLIERHPVMGWELLQNAHGLTSDVLDAVRHHHELLDGSGYPDGLCDDQIGDLVRMLTIVDVFSALIEARSYKQPMSRENAYRTVVGMAGRLEMPLIRAFREVALTR